MPAGVVEMTGLVSSDRPGILRRLIRAALPVECRLRIASAACAAMEVARRIFDMMADDPPPRRIVVDDPNPPPPPAASA